MTNSPVLAALRVQRIETPSWGHANQSHNVEDKIPALIRSVMNVQKATAKALLVDADALPWRSVPVTCSAPMPC
jgi:L-rhamnose isomerase